MRFAKVFLAQLIVLVFLLVLAIRPFFQGKETEIAQATPAPEERCISILLDGTTKELELEEYVVGVVLAEMPAEYELEALKAQAVVARTFAWKAACTGGKHGDGSVCPEPSCCQGYLTPAQYLQDYGTAAQLQRVRSAVMDTSDMVLTYAGEPIEATYFSSASGYTEDAVAVWGNSYPYLTAKPSPEEIQEETVAFSSGYLGELLGVVLGEEPTLWFTHWRYTQGGGVDSVTIGDKAFTGTTLRYRLGLRSTAFSVDIQNDVITFTTKGYGHRVGMSQLGAEAMAAEGDEYPQILTYYYTGTELKKIGEFD